MHTDGPWGWTYDGSSDYSIGPEDDPQVNPVAHVHSRDPQRGAEICDLLSAAPSMLTLLKAIRDDASAYPWHIAVETAIKKATRSLHDMAHRP